jgi:serine/threonine-protein kinase
MEPGSARPRGAVKVFPQQLGRYSLLAPIGTGGMATVYLARLEGARGFARHVAVKVLHPHLAESEEFVRQFATEAKIAARVRHPNVVPVLDVVEDPDAVYLVMDYVEGDTLSGLIHAAEDAGEPLPASVSLRIVCDALEGLHAAHELRDERGELAGVVHRDFSPHNILVGVDGLARLGDFGVAKILTAMPWTRTGVLKGKVRYMSPEQARGGYVDRRCDVWAAGVMVWELFAGRHLFDQDSEPAILMQIANSRPPALREVCAGVPAAVDEAVAWALQRSADVRCPTALLLRERIERAWEPQGGLAAAAEVGGIVRRLCDQAIELDPDESVSAPSGPSRMSASRRAATDLAATSPSASGRRAAAARAALVGSQPAAGVGAGAGALGTDVRTLSSANLTSVPGTGPRARGRARSALLLGAVALAGAALGAGVLHLRLRGSAPRASTEAASGMAASVAASAPAAASRSQAPRATEPSPLQIVSDTPLAALRVGERWVVFTEPVSSVSVPLPAVDAGAVAIEVVSADGRSARVDNAVAGGTVQLVFPPPVPESSATPSAAAPRPARQAPAPAAAELPRSPYE